MGNKIDGALRLYTTALSRIYEAIKAGEITYEELEERTGLTEDHLTMIDDIRKDVSYNTAKTKYDQVISEARQALRNSVIRKVITEDDYKKITGEEIKI